MRILIYYFPFLKKKPTAGPESREGSRTEEIMSDAAYVILVQDSKTYSGNFCIDEEVLRAQGITDLDRYSVVPGAQLLDDFFVDPDHPKAINPAVSEAFLQGLKKTSKSKL